MKTRDILRPEAFRKARPLRRLGAWLGYHGLTYSALAERMGVSRGTLGSVLHGKRTSRPLVEKVAAEAGLDADELEADLRKGGD